MMTSASYIVRRGEIETYFDKTAAQDWAKLTSDAPVSGIRATVRAGRADMRETILRWLPQNLSGTRLLDAGCGTGTLSVEAARRGAHVTAIDLSANLVALARSRLPADLCATSIDYSVGDMRDARLGEFDYIIAMDSLIHYGAADMAKVAASLISRARRSAIFTFAPRTKLLTLMHVAGRLFPRADRAPAIEPISPTHLKRLLEMARGGGEWALGREHSVSTAFYKSRALELVR